MPEFDDGLSVNLCQDNGEIFFRSADVARFDRVFQAVVQDAQHLLMTSQYDGAIDHYGKMMLNRLKMRSGMAVETYMPASTEALVSRFNELVNSMSVEQARGEEPSQAPGRIIIVNDPKAVDSDSWALLSRMITDFPGLNMRLVFLLDRMPAAVEKALDRFGSRLLSWEIEPPSATEQLALRKEGMQSGLEFQVERVLSRINQTVSRQLEPDVDGGEQPSLQIDVSDALGEATEAGEREAEDMRALFEEDAAPKKRGGGLLWAIAVLVCAVLATAIAGFVSPDVGRQIDRVLVMAGVEQSIFGRDEGGQSVVDAAYDAAQTETPGGDGLLLPELAPLPDEALEAPVMPETARTELAEAVADESAEDNELAASDETNSAEQASTEEAPAENLTEIQTDVAPTVVETEIPTAEAAQVEETQTVSEEQTAVSADVEPEAEVVDPVIRAVQAAPASAQFVQHIVYSSRARATAWQASQPNLTDALVVPITINGATQFAVVSGPFVDQGRTRAFVQGLGADADYWVRTAGSLQQILQTGE